MEIYTPSPKLMQNLEVLLTDFDPAEFYRYLTKMREHNFRAVEKTRGKKGRLFVEELSEYIPLEPRSDDGMPYIEVLDRIFLVPEKNHPIILGGLKEFYPKKYDAEAFEKAGKYLATCYPEKTPHNAEIFEVLDEALRINAEGRARSIMSLFTRERLLLQASFHGLNSSNPEHRKKAAEYGGGDLNKTMQDIAEYAALHKALEGED